VGESAGAQIIAVGGGKGGVGKSLVACNLAVSLARLGKRVVLADLDLGSANQHLLLGIARPRPGVQRLFDGEVEDIHDALTPTGIPNLSLLAGTGAVLGAGDISVDDKHRLLQKLRSLHEVVVLDIGAGVGYNALDFFLLGAQKLVVTTPQVTALHDVYGFLKSAVLRALQEHTAREIDAALLEPALLSRESTRVLEVLERLRVQRPELAERVFRSLQHFGAKMIGNQLTEPTQLKVLDSVTRMMHDYLGIDVPVLGTLSFTKRIHASVNERRPLAGNGGPEARTLERMAEALLASRNLVSERLTLDDLAVSAGVHRRTVAAARARLPGMTVTPPPHPVFRQATGS
jgi:flagellar biosynthesis protein FlhG